MSDVIDIGYSLDASGYAAGVSAVEQANQRLRSSNQQAAQSATTMQRAMASVTPARAAAAGLLAVSAQAATAEQRMLGLETQAQSSGANFEELRNQVKSLATDMPIGQQGGLAIVKTVNEMGIAGEGAEQKIGALSTSIAQLSGATGEAPRDMAKSITELARATGNRDLDPTRLSAVGDSLVTVSAQMGASTQATTQFARQMAPMAREAGLGAAAVTGYGAAFAKMGDEGLGAAANVQSMVSGINTAIRDGGPALQSYAELAGMTADQFGRLYEADPHRAISGIVSNVAQGGAGAQRGLEHVGIEGVSGQQQFQQLAASGGLDEAVRTAIGAYGSGSTAEASETAYSGLTNELTKTKEAAGQLGEALGTPLLAPLSALAEGLGGVVGLLAKIIGSGPGQAAMTAAGVLGTGAFLGSKVAGPLAGYAVARQMGTSGPMRALAAGWAVQRGLDPSTSRIARFGQPITDRYNDNSLLRDNQGNIIRGTQAIDPVTGAVVREGVSRRDASLWSRSVENSMMYGMGAASHGREPTQGERDARRGTNAARRRQAMGLGMLGVNAFANSMAVPIRDAWTRDPYQRSQGTMGPIFGGQGVIGGKAWEEAAQRARDEGHGRIRSQWAGAQAFTRAMDPQYGKQQPSGFSIRQANAQQAVARLGPDAGGMRQAAAAMRGFTQSVEGAAKRTNYFTQSLGTMTRATTRVAGSTARDAGRGLGRGAAALGGAAVGMMGGLPGLAVMGVIGAGTLGYNAYQKRQEEIDYFGSYADKDMYASINRYRESMGAAADTKTTADVNKRIRDELGTSARVDGWDASKRVTSADAAGAQKSSSKDIISYYGDPEQVAGQIIAGNQQGITPQELSAIKGDLLNQFDVETTNEILGHLPDSIEAGKSGTSSKDFGDAAAEGIQGVSDKRRNRAGWKPWGQGLNGKEKESLDAMIAGVSQRAEESEGSAEFITQQRTQDYNELLKAAAESGDHRTFDYVSKAVASSIDPKLKDETWAMTGDENDLLANPPEDGDYLKVMARESDKYAGERKAAAKEGAKFAPGAEGGVAETAETSPTVKGIREDSWFLSDMWNSDRQMKWSDPSWESWRLQQDSLEKGPNDLQARDQATRSMVSAAEEAGTSLTDLSNKALDSARNVKAGGDAWQRLQQVSQESRAKEDSQLAIEGDPTESRRVRIKRLHADATRELTSESTEEEVEARDQAREGLLQEGVAMREHLANRLKMQRSYDIQEQRATRNYNRSKARQEEDFRIQQGRAEEEFGIQRARSVTENNIRIERAERDFNIQRSRAFEQFGIQISRAERDYGIQRARAIEDNNIQINRAERDFGIQRSRAVEDNNIQVARAERDFGIQRSRAIEDNNIQVARAERDFGIQRARAIVDNNIQVMRAERDYGIQRGRAIEDNNIQVMRAERDYAIQRGRQLQDFNIQQRRAIEDFTTSTERATRDFGINLRRQLEDAAKNIFDPYSRVQAKPTWDARTLAGNMDEQNEMMNQQLSDLKTLRKGGISEDAIRVLDLANFDNAQQTSNLVADLSPEMVRNINRIVKERGEAAAELFKDKSNTMLERQREDFNRSMGDQVEDFNKQMSRSQADFSRSLGRSAKDFSRAMRDMNSDFNRSMRRTASDFRKSMRDMHSDFTRAMRRNDRDFRRSLRDQHEDFVRAMRRNARDFRRSMSDMHADFTRAMSRNDRDFRRAMRDQEADFVRAMARTEKDFRRGLADMRADFNRSMKWQRADFNRSMDDAAKDFRRSLEYQQKDFNRSQQNQREDFNRSQKRQMQDFNTQMADMKRDIKEADLQISGSMTDLANQTQRAMTGKAVQYSKIMKSDTDAIARDLKRDVVPKIVDSYADLGISKSDLRNSGSKASGKRAATSENISGPQRFAEGGRIDGHSPHDKADNIPALLTAGEFVQPVKRVKEYGIEAMEAVRRGTATIVDEAGRAFGGAKGIVKENMAHMAGNGMGGPDWKNGLPAFNRGGMVYKEMAAWVRKNLPGVVITSDYRPGSITATGNKSNHGKGKALDLAPSMSTFNKILSAFGGSNILELIYSPAGGRQIAKGRRHNYGQPTRGDHWDHVHWAMNSMSGGGGLGLFMAPELEDLFKGIEKNKKKHGHTYGVLADQAKRLIQERMGELAMDGGSIDYKPSAGIAQWADEVREALRIMNQPLSLTNTVLRRLNQESSGNPNIVNKWDSNWRRGTPSAGLMQVIGPTYKAYKHPQYDRGPYSYGTSLDPLSNILASMRYALSRYGSLSRAYNLAGGYADGGLVKQGVYDNGGVIDPGATLVHNRSRKPEALLSNEQWSNISTMAEAAAQMLTKSDLRNITASHGAPLTINHNERITYDNRNDFGNAQITVQSEDPDEMARKLEARERRSRLTVTRGVRR